MHGRIAVFSIVVAVVLLLATSATATATLTSWTLTVQKEGNGQVSGTGIDCGADCSETYPNNCSIDPVTHVRTCEPQPATVTASSANGYDFVSWSGCDQVTNASCTVDSGGDTTVTAHFHDGQAPTAALTAPSAGAKSGTFTIAATASDNSGLIANVRFKVRGVIVATDSSAPYSMSFDSTNVADGSAAVAAEAIDSSGNAFQTAPTTVTIDNTWPELGSINGPGAGPFGPGTTQSFDWTVSDATSGLASVLCKLDSGAFGSCTSNTTMSYTGLGDGSHTLTVRATDNVGHTVSRTVTWSIDTVAPVAQITGGPADGSSSTDTGATFTFTSNESGSFQCRVYQSALTPPAFGACSGNGSHVVSGLALGSYTFEVLAIDTAGNQSAPEKRTFTVAAAPPPPPPPPPSATTDGSGSGAPTVGESAGGATDSAPSAPATVVVAARVSAKWSLRSGKTRVRRLRLSRLPSGARITVTCRARNGCPFRSKRFRAKHGKLDLTKRLRKPLRAGSRITITITRAGMTGQRIVFTARKTKQPKKSTKALT